MDRRRGWGRAGLSLRGCWFRPGRSGRHWRARWGSSPQTGRQADRQRGKAWARRRTGGQDAGGDRALGRPVPTIRSCSNIPSRWGPVRSTTTRMCECTTRDAVRHIHFVLQKMDCCIKKKTLARKKTQKYSLLKMKASMNNKK